MLEYEGKYGTAEVMIDIIDPTTVSQIYEFLNHEAFTNPIVIMPDCHKGNGAVIGFTMPMTDKVIPNVVGVDIGCGMLSMNVGKGLFKRFTKSDIDGIIREKLPMSTNVHPHSLYSIENDIRFFKELHREIRAFTMAYNKKFGTTYSVTGEVDFDSMCDVIGMDYGRMLNSIGTLGGGNHFIEAGKSEKTGDYWITFHSGSRQFGLKVCQYHQKLAGKGELAYLEGFDAFDYLVDMVIAQKYANENREVMATVVMKALDLEVRETIVSVHNYIDFNDFIIRKGAITSYNGQKMIIPWNMEDGITICEGKSNPEWNYSAPHGAGRLGSRSWAKKKFSSEVAKERMKSKGIYTSVVPVDEVKEAYKDHKLIEDALYPTAKIIDRLIPVINLKSK